MFSCLVTRALPAHLEARSKPPPPQIENPLCDAQQSGDLLTIFYSFFGGEKGKNGPSEKKTRHESCRACHGRCWKFVVPGMKTTIQFSTVHRLLPSFVFTIVPSHCFSPSRPWWFLLFLRNIFIIICVCVCVWVKRKKQSASHDGGTREMAKDEEKKKKKRMFSRCRRKKPTAHVCMWPPGRERRRKKWGLTRVYPTYSGIPQTTCSDTKIERPCIM